MSRSTFAMATAALAATTSAAFNAGAKNNVAIYWGQGSNVDLSIVCNDASIDIVNLAFVNEFPKSIGDYPKSNFANSCGEYFDDPKNPGQKSGLLNCPTFSAGIAQCHKNNKKVMLSLGGGWPIDYYLPSKDVAEWFAGWMLDAFGPKRAGYKGIRPFGDEGVDGFDLDLEADASQVPADGIWQYYAAFVNKVKALQPNTLISAAPQCQVPDPRLANAISNAKFDMIFTQFYNTDECSARVGYNELSKATNDANQAFTFNKWLKWLQDNSVNKNVKLYLGLGAGVDGIGASKDHYLKPDEANALITKWQKSTNFGGVMLWSHTVSTNNVVNCHSYHYWMKSALNGQFISAFKSCTSSSSSSARPSSSSVASSSVRPSSSSAILSSSVRPSSSSAVLSSSVLPSSSSIVPSASSSIIPSTTSAAVIPTATITSPGGTCGDQKNGVVYTCKGFNGGDCCSEYGYCGGLENGLWPRSAYCGAGCNPLYGNCDSISSSSVVISSSASPSASLASSSAIVSSSAVQSSSAVVSSSAVLSSSAQVSSSAVVASSVVVSSSAVQSSSAQVSSSAVQSSSVQVSSSAAVSSSASVAQSSASASSVAVSSSAVASSSAPAVSSSVSSYSASTPAASSSGSVVASSAASSSAVASSSVGSSSGSVIASSSVASSSGSAVASSSGSVAPTVVYPAHTTSHVPYPTGGSSSFPSFSSAPYPMYNVSSSHVPVYGDSTPAASSTPCTTSSTSSQPVVASSTPCTTSSKPVVPSSKPSYPEYPASSAPSYPQYPASSAPSYPQYPASSKPSYPEYPASSKPSYPEYPASSTTKVITTTYVDSCATGLTTKTETITKTVCNKCTKPVEDSVTSIYVCKNCGPSVVTVTITKPNVPATGVPAKPTGPVYGGDKPQPPAQPAKPSSPVYGGGNKPSGPVYSADIKKQNEATSTTVQIVYVTKTPVPVVPVVPAYTPVVYPSGPAKNATASGYPTKPTGTGVPSKPTYAPPQFTGAASRVGAGLTGVVALAAGILML